MKKIEKVKSRLLRQILKDGFVFKTTILGWEIYVNGDEHRVYNPAEDREEIKYTLRYRSRR